MSAPPLPGPLYATLISDILCDHDRIDLKIDTAAGVCDLGQ